MKKTSLILVFLVFQLSFSQKVEIKDDLIYFDNKETLKFIKNDLIEFSILSLNDDEIIYSNFHNNETETYYEDDYIVINFISEKIKVESTKDENAISGLGLNSKKNLKKLIEWLVKEKVIKLDGTLDKDRIAIFYDKFNENITNRTVR